jgi:hypothetical protein
LSHWTPAQVGRLIFRHQLRRTLPQNAAPLDSPPLSRVERSGSGSPTADPGATVLGVQLSQIQDEVIDKAHCEGTVNPAAFSRMMRHDLGDIHAAINDLVNRGLLAAADSDTFRLTDQGEAVHRRQEDAHRAAVVSRTRTWQPR